MFFQSNASISIEIETSEILEISEILQTALHQYPQAQQTRRFSIMCTSFSRGIFQMTGLILTLVGANLLTVKLEPLLKNQPTDVNITMNQPADVNITINQAINKNLTETKMKKEPCENDYGCVRNLCWRACSEKTITDEQDEAKFCFTASKPNGTSNQLCKYSHDCSPCAPCLTPCQFSMTFDD